MPAVVHTVPRDTMPSQKEYITELFDAVWKFAVEGDRSTPLAGDMAEAYAEVVAQGTALPLARHVNLLGITQFRNGKFGAARQTLLKAKKLFALQVVSRRFQFDHQACNQHLRDRALNLLYLAMSQHQTGDPTATSTIAEARQEVTRYEESRVAPETNVVHPTLAKAVQLMR